MRYVRLDLFHTAHCAQAAREQVEATLRQLDGWVSCGCWHQAQRNRGLWVHVGGSLGTRPGSRGILSKCTYCSSCVLLYGPQVVLIFTAIVLDACATWLDKFGHLQPCTHG